MVICFDCDGTITKNGGWGLSEVNVPWWILKIVFSIYNPKINEEVLELMAYYKKRKKKVLVITCRPKELSLLTWKYLEKETKKNLEIKEVPVDKIIFLGPGPNSSQKKIATALKENVEIFYDNSEKTIERAKKSGITSFLV